MGWVTVAIFSHAEEKIALSKHSKRHCPIHSWAKWALAAPIGRATDRQCEKLRFRIHSGRWRFPFESYNEPIYWSLSTQLRHQSSWGNLRNLIWCLNFRHHIKFRKFRCSCRVKYSSSLLHEILVYGILETSNVRVNRTIIYTRKCHFETSPSRRPHRRFSCMEFRKFSPWYLTITATISAWLSLLMRSSTSP